ncbi:MAG TPA: GNAT family N-acetyltransferase, partial [Polyangiales bacterium]
SVRVERVHGHAIEPYLRDLAALRIELFREYPYLYRGETDYEARYLRSYAESDRSVVVVARDGADVVGAATAMPLAQHSEAVAPALVAAGHSPEHVYYFGESVLRASYRRRGIGHAFFDAREAAAREFGFAIATFCAVVRPSDHPRKPPNYVPHDAFWTKRGYVKRPDITTHFAWTDLDDADETDKTMLFWIKELGR